MILRSVPSGTPTSRQRAQGGARLRSDQLRTARSRTEPRGVRAPRARAGEYGEHGLALCLPSTRASWSIPDEPVVFLRLNAETEISTACIRLPSADQRIVHVLRRRTLPLHGRAHVPMLERLLNRAGIMPTLTPWPTLPDPVFRFRGGAPRPAWERISRSPMVHPSPPRARALRLEMPEPHFRGGWREIDRGKQGFHAGKSTFLTRSGDPRPRNTAPLLGALPATTCRESSQG